MEAALALTAGTGVTRLDDGQSGTVAEVHASHECATCLRGECACGGQALAWVHVCVKIGGRFTMVSSDDLVIGVVDADADLDALRR